MLEGGGFEGFDARKPVDNARQEASIVSSRYAGCGSSMRLENGRAENSAYQSENDRQRKIRNERAQRKAADEGKREDGSKVRSNSDDVMWRTRNLTEVGRDDSCQPIGLFTDETIVFAFDHNTQHGFGAGIADEDPTAAVETAFAFGDRLLQFGDAV